MKIFVIYKEGEGFILRHLEVTRSLPYSAVLIDPELKVNTLEEARAQIPEGLYRIPRDVTDAPEIIESWI